MQMNCHLFVYTNNKQVKIPVKVFVLTVWFYCCCLFVELPSGEEQKNKMKILSFFLMLFALHLLLCEGVQVSNIKKGGNVYVNVIVPHSKKIFGLMKILDKKLDRLFKAVGSHSGLSCPKGEFNAGL